MKIAFLLLAHKYSEQLLILTKLLDHPDIDIYVHLDLKLNVNFEKFSRSIKGKNVYVLPNRVDAVWGGYSILRIQLFLLKIALKNGKYSHLSFISGQDLPIKSTQYLVDFFKCYPKTDFLEYFSLPSVVHWNGELGLDRFRYYWPIDQLGLSESYKFYQKQMEEKTIRKMPSNLTPYGGSNWVTISSESAEKIFQFIKKNPTILMFFSLVSNPDEMFFQTVILNTAAGGTIVNSNLRYIDWSENRRSPKILTTDDLSIMTSSDAHFARKFDAQIDSNIIEWIRKEIHI